MQNVVIAKPYKFVPPDRGRFWPAVFRPLLRPLLAKVWGVTTVEIVGIESLLSALRERASVLLAPNHCRPCDATVVAVLGAQAGTPLYIMASWHQFMGRRSKAWLLRRLGAFSVYREGLDRTAVRTAIELLVEARRPLAIFPEGIITRSNDRLGALYEGPAFIAHSAAKRRAKNEPGARTLLIPVALRYRFLGRLEESAGPVLDRIETRLTWAPRPDLPLIERLRRAGDAILGLKELELVGEFRHATIAERLARLVDDILGPLEAEWKVKGGERDVPTRVRSSHGDPAGSRGRGTLRCRARPALGPARPALPGAAAFALSGRLSRGPPEHRTRARDGRTTRRRLDRCGDRAPAARRHGVRGRTARRRRRWPAAGRAHKRRSRSNRNPAQHSLRKRSRARTWPCLLTATTCREVQAIHSAVTTRVENVVGPLHLATP